VTSLPPGPGAVLDDRYALEGLLGSGGMGEVFRARDLVAQDAPVAVKVLNAEASAAVRVRFMREARLASQLRHPHIVPVLTYARANAQHLYLVMELVEGAPLSKVMGALPTGQLVGLLDQVLEALAHVHARGVLHRDIKPDNILIGRRPDGELLARLSDFGIAGMTHPEHHDETRLTQEGSMIGTPHYMAPEQAAGELYIGPAADLYPIGVMIYEALCEAPPFEGPPLTLLLKKLQEDVPEPTDLDAWPEGLWDLTCRLLARQPELRPRTAAELRSDLAPFAQTPRVDAPRWSALCGHSARVTAATTAASPPAAALAPTSATPRAAEPANALWGRVSERRQLMALADEAEAGELRLGLVRGPLGVGKSRLIEHIGLELAESGRFEQLGCGFGPGAGAGGLRILVERALGTLGRTSDEVEALARGFLRRHGGADDRELAELLAFLRPKRRDDGSAAPPSEQQALVLRVLRMKARRGPLALLLEDIHHATDDVVRFLQMAAFEATYEPLPLLILATSRADLDGALTGDLEPLLRPAGPARDVTLAPMAPEALADGLRARYGIPLRHAERLAARAAGNPLFAELLVNADATLDSGASRTSEAQGLPERLAGLMLGQLQAKLAEHSDTLRPLLERLALLGSPVSTALLEAFCEDLEGDFDDALDSLIRLEVVAENLRDDTLRFRHPLLEEAIAAGLTGRRVRKLHAHAAALREEMGTPLDGQGWAIGRHLAMAARPAEAVNWWLRGLEWELAAGDGLRAVYCAEHALEHMADKDERTLRLRLQLGKLRLDRGALEEAITTVAPVIDGPDPLLAIEALYFSYRLQDEFARTEEAKRLADRIEAFAQSDDATVRRAAQRAQLYVLNTMLRADEAVVLARRLLAEELDVDDRFHILQRLCFSYVILHSVGAGGGTALTDQIRDVLSQTDALLPDQSPENWLTAVHAASGMSGVLFGYEAVRPRLEKAKAMLRRAGRPGPLLRIMLREVYVALLDDRFARAMELLDEGRRLLDLFPTSELRLRHELFEYMARTNLNQDPQAIEDSLRPMYEALEGGSLVALAKGWFRLIGAYRAARKQCWAVADRYLDENKDFGIRGLGIPRTMAEDMKRLLRPVEHAWPGIAHWLATIDGEWAHGFPHKAPLAG